MEACVRIQISHRLAIARNPGITSPRLIVGYNTGNFRPSLLFCIGEVFFPNVGKNKAPEISEAFVPKEGVEPSLPKEHEFESCASTNSATLAFSKPRKQAPPAGALAEAGKSI